LDLGDEPALPLSRLEAIPDSSLPQLVEKLRQKTASISSDDDGVGNESSDENNENVDEDSNEDPEDDSTSQSSAPLAEAPEPTPQAPDLEDSDARQVARRNAFNWAQHLVTAGRLIPRPRKNSAADRRLFEQAVEAAAQRIVRRVVLPGEWYLVRWGGTRKGA